MDTLELTLRKFTIEKLKTFKTLIDHITEPVTTTTISGMLSVEGRELGGRLSSFSRTKIDGEPLLMPVGKSEEGVLWKLNPKVGSKQRISELLEQILLENKEFRMATEEKDLRR